MTVILRVRAVSTGWQGAPGLNTFYWRPGTGGGSNADAVDCVARVRAFFATITAQMHNSVRVQVAGAVDAIEDTTGALVAGFAGGSPAVVTATGIGDMMPPALACLVRLNTGVVVAGRFLRGRWFLPPFLEAANTIAGGVQAVDSAAVDTAATAMLTGGATASFPVVWHRPGPSGAGTSMAVNDIQVWSSWASLRSRRD